MDEAGWHAWYVEARRIAAAARPGDAVPQIVRSWLLVARPIALRVHPSRLEANMVVGDDGGTYVLAPAADDAAATLQLEPSGRWATLRSAAGALLRRYLVVDPLDPGTWQRANVHTYDRHRRFHTTGRPYRSGPQPLPIARALAVRGLVESGLSQGAALRAWVLWPESDAPVKIRQVAVRIRSRRRGSRHLQQPERDARLADRQTWATWEGSVRREHRRVWAELGIAEPDTVLLVTSD